MFPEHPALKCISYYEKNWLYSNLMTLAQKLSMHWSAVTPLGL